MKTAFDVREKDEYQAGHIPGAVSISRGLLEFKLSTDSELAPRDTRLVLIAKPVAEPHYALIT